MFTVAFLKILGERVLAAGASALVALLTTGGIGGLSDVNWLNALSVTGLAMLVAALYSVVGGKVTSSPTPDFTSQTTQDGMYS